MHKKVGQITIKRIGDRWAACISGTPKELYNSFKQAEKMVIELRKKHGRRHYQYPKSNGNRKCKK